MTDELRELCSAAVEGTLTPGQSRRLGELIAADPGARRFLAEHLHLHASLVWAAADAKLLAEDRGQRSEAGGQGTGEKKRNRENSRLSSVLWPLSSSAGWAVAACLLVGLGLSLYARTAPRTFAELADVGGCKWESGSLPTESGARLGAGRLRLAEGVARIVFDTGAELRLEGPADLELHARDRCTLRSGRLVARCPDPARGFLVETPSASLQDLGTEFGVSVTDGKADVQVFEGRVDATHRGTGRVEQLLTGRGMRFTPDAAVAHDPRSEGPRPADAAPGLRPGQRLVTITTASGRGRDAYVAGKPHLPHRSGVLILVKSTVPESADYFRKGYVGFDLAALGGAKVVGAQLAFTQVPTGMGFASEVPDSTFSVHGVTDDALNHWPENGLLWEDAPGNAPGGSAVDPARTVKVGEFRLPQGVQSGVWSVNDPALAAFLNARTNGFATLVLVRDTLGSGRNDYVHGFAGKDHPTLPPPTLKLVVEGE